MALRDRLNRLRADTVEIERDRLAQRYAGKADTTIADAPLRQRGRIAGEITSIRVVPRAGSPSLEVSVNDGTGLAVAIFTGRRQIPGITPSRGIALEGVPRQERNRILLLNPTYTLLP
jgi:hypothetical protein